MELGVFIPIGNNGWLISTTSPQYRPTFDLNREIVEKAERFGFDFALSMIKLHGFGGPSQFWDYNLESFTLMAGLAAVTNRIQLFATCAVLTLPPPIAARMAVTIDSISHGRFGINIISGWQRREYTQMGIWPGSEHYRRRYEYCAEYVTIMRELWQAGHSDFKGDFFQMDDCRCCHCRAQRSRSSAPRKATPVPGSLRNTLTTISAAAAASTSRPSSAQAWRASSRRRPQPAATAAR